MSPSEWVERLDRVDEVVQSLGQADFSAADKVTRLYWWYYLTSDNLDNWQVTLEMVWCGKRARAGVTITPPFSDEPRRATWWSQIDSHERVTEGPPIPEAALLQYALVASVLLFHLEGGETP